MRPIVSWIIAATAGFVGYSFVLPHAMTDGWAVYMKVTGKAPTCSWDRVFGFFSSVERLDELDRKYKVELKVEEYDKEANLERFTWPGGRSFWAQRLNGKMRGYGWLLAEHQWMREISPAEQVKKGDVVIDCGAHIGVFTWRALEAGAAKVIAVEPDPANLESLRRNFPKEIAEGRLVLAPVAVWNSTGTMKLNLGGGGNTGINSLIHNHGARSIDVPLTTVDLLVKEHGLDRVDYIKMDIEGAEREALKGARETLAKWKPRLMLDLNHMPDDMTVLPRVIREANPAYISVCGPCQMNEHKVSELVPHVVYFR